MDAILFGRASFARFRLTLGIFFAGAVAVSAQSIPDAAPIEPRGSASVPPYVEYDKRVRASEQLSPLSGELFGEDVSLYTGATEFSHVDIDIPGNNALPVQLRRRLAIGALVPDQAHDAFRGATDNIECKDADCYDLSTRRARMIYDWLRGRGVPSESLYAFRGFATENPISGNKDEEERQRSRRAEFGVIRTSYGRGGSLIDNVEERQHEPLGTQNSNE